MKVSKYDFLVACFVGLAASYFWLGYDWHVIINGNSQAGVLDFARLLAGTVGFACLFVYPVNWAKRFLLLIFSLVSKIGSLIAGIF